MAVSYFIPTVIFFVHCNYLLVEATFSMSAADISAHQVGGVGSTCIEVGGLSIYDTIYHSVPGKHLSEELVKQQ